MMFGSNAGAAEAARRIPSGSVGVEIGVWKGDSSAKFLARASHLHLVDPWSVVPYRDSDEHGGFSDYLLRYARLVGSSEPEAFQAYYEGVYCAVVNRFKGKPVTIHRCTSAEFFARFRGTVDWVYLDGSHSFEGCLSDLRAARRIARWAILGDDYGNKPGVTRAVDDFVAETGLALRTFSDKQYEIRL